MNYRLHKFVIPMSPVQLNILNMCIAVNAVLTRYCYLWKEDEGCRNLCKTWHEAAILVIKRVPESDNESDTLVDVQLKKIKTTLGAELDACMKQYKNVNRLFYLHYKKARKLTMPTPVRPPQPIRKRLRVFMN